jgi:hypothetical protein
MGRKLFTLAAGASAVLCVGVCAMWVRGRSGIDDLGWYTVRWPDADHRQRREYTLRSAGGHFVLIRVDNNVNLSFAAEVNSGMRGPADVEQFRLRNPAGTHFFWSRTDGEARARFRGFGSGAATRPTSPVWQWLAANVQPHNWLGFGYEFRTGGNRGRTDIYRRLVVPAWLPALLAGAGPAAWFGRRLRDRRRLGKGRCAICGYDLRATPDRCPECGAVPKEAE